MNSAQIKAAIAASPELQALAQEGNVDAIARLLSIGKTKTGSHFASERGILERFPGGPLAADAMLTKLEAFASSGHPMASIVKRALKFLAQPEGLDIGSPATQALLGQLALGGVITEEERAGLQTMATVPDPISREQVTEAVYHD